LGRSILDFMDPPSRRLAEGGFLERLRALSEQQEFRFLRKDGAPFWALLAGSPIRDESGAATGALGMLTDINQLKTAEEALRRSEAEFRVVFENAAIGMALVDVAGRLVRSNPALQQFLRRPPEELRALTLDDVIDPADRAAESGPQQALLRGERDSLQGEC